MKTVGVRHSTVLKDCLYNLNQSSGASDEYCKGIVVGIASLLVSQGASLDDAMYTIALHLPKSHRAIADVAPESWADDLQRYDTMTLYTR